MPKFFGLVLGSLIVSVVLLIYFTAAFAMSSLASKASLTSYMMQTPINHHNVLFLTCLGAVTLLAAASLIGYGIQNILLIRTRKVVRFEWTIIPLVATFIIITQIGTAGGQFDFDTDLRSPSYLGDLSLAKSFLLTSYLSSLVFCAVSVILSPLFYIARRITTQRS